MSEQGNFRVLEPIQDVSEYEDMKKDENMTDAERGLAVMLADLHGDGQEQEGYLGVYRETGGPGGNHEFLEKIPLDKYDPISLEQYVSDKYGPGDYRIHARVKGQKGIKGNKLLTIGAPKDNGTGTAMVPYHQQQNQGGQSDLAMVLQQMNYQHQEMMAAFSQKPGGIVDSLADTIKSMDAEKLSVFATLLTPVIKNLFGNKNDPMQQLQSMLAITGQVKELQQDNNQEDDSLTGLAKAFLPALAGARQNDQQNGAETLAPKQPEQMSAQKPAQDENAYLRHLMEAFKPMIDELLNHAREDADPDVCAATVVQSVQPDALPTFIQFMEREDSIYNLGQYQPAILSHAVWFSELRGAILDHYYDPDSETEPGADDVSTTPPAGANAESGGQHESPQQPGGDGGYPGTDGETGEGQ